MGFSVIQSQNLNLVISSLFPQEKTEPNRSVVTISSIAKTMSDSFNRAVQTSSLQKMGAIQRNSLPRGTQLQPMPDNALNVVEWNDQKFSNVMIQQGNASLSVDMSVTTGTAAGNGAAGSTGDSGLDAQTAANMKQAQQIKNQLRLDNRVDWGVDSVAQDLAVFGLDFTSMDGDVAGLSQTLQEKAEEMLAALASPENAGNDNAAARNRITGALSRLTTGLAGAGMGAAASWSVRADVSTDVVVGGKSIDAGFVIDVGNVIVDPLVLDLNGDGLNLKSADEGVDFDMDGDGAASRMGFIRGDDALLFVDTHGDGVVHDGRQLFGNTDGHANGFEKLRAYDDNADGVIDKNDAIYDQLRLWVEKTGDGVSGTDETMSLAEAGVASINVGYENVREDDGTGNLIGQKGGFTRDDGSSGLAADVWFRELR